MFNIQSFTPLWEGSTLSLTDETLCSPINLSTPAWLLHYAQIEAYMLTPPWKEKYIYEIGPKQRNSGIVRKEFVLAYPISQSQACRKWSRCGQNDLIAKKKKLIVMICISNQMHIAASISIIAPFSLLGCCESIVLLIYL